MAEFLQLVENLKAEEASVKRLFEGEGQSARKRNGASPDYMKKLAEAADLLADVMSGKKPSHYIKEAMTTSDFPVLFGDILDRQILAAFQEIPSTWQAWIRRRTVNDFRPVEYRYTPEGASGSLERVHEQEEYPEASLDDISKVTYRIGKYGRRIPFSWEALVNDDVDMFNSIPDRFARAARRTESRFAVGLYVAATGPVAPFFSAGNNNLLTGPGSALSISSLQTALARFRDLKDDDGEPILVEAAILVIPPSLEITAQNILNATEMRINVATFGEGTPGGASDGQVTVGNWLRNRVRVVVDPYLSLINTTSGETAWYLFADPNSGRPAGEMAFLRGRENPEVFIKSPNAMRVGGGMVGPEEGDFDTDSIEYKVRHVLGGTRIEPKAAVAATGV